MKFQKKEDKLLKRHFEIASAVHNVGWKGCDRSLLQEAFGFNNPDSEK